MPPVTVTLIARASYRAPLDRNIHQFLTPSEKGPSVAVKARKTGFHGGE